MMGGAGAVSLPTLSPAYSMKLSAASTGGIGTGGARGGIQTSMSPGRPVAFNPFFDAIRQNMELGRGPEVGTGAGIALRLPKRVRRRAGELPFEWLREIARRSGKVRDEYETENEMESDSDSEDDESGSGSGRGSGGEGMEGLEMVTRKKVNAMSMGGLTTRQHPHPHTHTHAHTHGHAHGHGHGHQKTARGHGHDSAFSSASFKKHRHVERDSGDPASSPPSSPTRPFPYSLGNQSSGSQSPTNRRLRPLLSPPSSPTRQLPYAHNVSSTNTAKPGQSPSASAPQKLDVRPGSPSPDSNSASGSGEQTHSSSEPSTGDSLTRALELQFYRIELGEQRRLMGVMERHSSESGTIISKSSPSVSSLGVSDVVGGALASGVGFAPGPSLLRVDAENAARRKGTQGKGESEVAKAHLASFPFSITAGLEKGAKNR